MNIFKTFNRIEVFHPVESKKELQEKCEIAVRFEDILYCEAERLYFNTYEQQLAEYTTIYRDEQCDEYYTDCTLISTKLNGKFYVPMSIIETVKYLNSNASY